MTRLGAAALLSLVLPGAAVLRAQEDFPLVRAIEVAGNEVYSREQVLRIIRLRPGDRLRREPSAVASGLEARYRGVGFPAARVSGRFDEATGTLALSVDEGRLSRVEIEGLDASAAARAREEMALEPGRVVRAGDVRDALAALEKASWGAIEADAENPYEVAPGAEGTVLTVRVVARSHRLALRPAWFGAAALYNRFDGLIPAATVEATRFDLRDYNHLTAYATLAYGIRSGEFRGAVGARRGLGRDGALLAGYEWHDLTHTEDVFRPAVFEEAPGFVLGVGMGGDFFRRKGHEAHLFRRLGRGAQVGLVARAERYEPLDVETEGLVPTSADGLGRPTSTGDMRSLLALVRLSAGAPVFAHRASERKAVVVHAPFGTLFEGNATLRAEASAELAGMGGDFAFERYVAAVKGRWRVSPPHRLAARVLAGAGRDLPPPKRFALGGLGTLRGREFKDVVGDSFVLATAEWSLHPRAPRPGLAAFYDGGAAWGRRVGPRGWRSDVGVGLFWPADEGLLRLDLAWPLGGGAPGEKGGAKLTARIRVPL